MLLTPYRAQLQTALAEAPSQRKPFLRRSLRADALLTTDLPCVAAEADIADFVSRLRAQGWRVEALGNYLELTPTLHPPICTETPAWGADRVELRRLHSLLERHPEGTATEAEILVFLKAEEAGERALETLCRTLCRNCAERLRNHASLPGGLLPYAAGALMKEECLCC